MKILWSPLAEITYNDTLSYLTENWPVEVVQSFILEVERTMSILQVNPKIFPWWDQKQRIKVGYINKYISLFYSYTSDEIKVHLFWDIRRNPSNLKRYL